MHLGKVTDTDDNEIGLALRWSYGSVFGIWRGLVHRGAREPWANDVPGRAVSGSEGGRAQQCPRPTRACEQSSRWRRCSGGTSATVGAASRAVVHLLGVMSS